MRRLDTGRLAVLGLRAAGRVPGGIVRAVCAAAADVAWLAHGGGVRQLEANLRRVRPDLRPRELRRLSREGMRSYLRYYGEVFTLASLTRDQLEARVRTTGLDKYAPLLGAGETIVLGLGHLANWDLAGAWATAHVARVVTVAEHLEPEELFQEFLGLRERLGLTIIPLKKNGGDVFRDLVRAVRGGPGLLPLLADRDLTARGVEVALFGEVARVAAGPAALAVATGARIAGTSIHYERLRGARRRAAGSPWGIVVEFGDLLEAPTQGTRADKVQALTQGWVDELARGIAAHPQDWHMLQKVWVTDLDADRYAATLAAQGRDA
ncbi:MAG: phosphatidylinositol mannoside acyltransferase [Cellulomonas sp.]